MGVATTVRGTLLVGGAALLLLHCTLGIREVALRFHVVGKLVELVVVVVEGLSGRREIELPFGKHNLVERTLLVRFGWKERVATRAGKILAERVQEQEATIDCVAIHVVGLHRVIKMFTEVEETIRRDELADELAKVLGEVGVNLIFLGNVVDDEIPRGTEVTTEDRTELHVAVLVLEVETMDVAGIEVLVDRADEAFFVGRVGAKRDLLLAGNRVVVLFEGVSKTSRRVRFVPKGRTELKRGLLHGFELHKGGHGQGKEQKSGSRKKIQRYAN